MPQNSILNPIARVVQASAVLFVGLVAGCLPELDILPTENLPEGDQKTLVAQVKPAYCAYNAIAVEYREQGAAAWTPLPSPTIRTGAAGYRTYQVGISVSSGFPPNHSYETAWTVHVPQGSGWWYSYWCGADVDVRRTATFNVQRAFDVSFSPSPVKIPAGQNRTLTLQAQRYGGFTGVITVTSSTPPAGITVTPPSVTITGFAATMTVAAALNLPPGNQSIPLDAAATSVTGANYVAPVQIEPPFTLTATPDPVEVPIGGAASLTIGVNRVPGFAGSVTVGVSGLSPHVTANPSSITIAGSGAAVGIAADRSAAPGSSTILLSGSAAVVVQDTRNVNVNVGRPIITALSPNTQERDLLVTANGSSFNATCALNTVIFGTVGTSPASCAATSLVASVPSTAGFGNTIVSVTSGGMVSNSLPFRVRRKAGSFTNVTSNITTTSGRTCPTGLVKLDVSGTGGAYTATYRNTSTNAVIASRTFDWDSDPFDDPGGGDWTVTAAGVGGAGFASCTTGIVVDMKYSACATRMAIVLLNLESGAAFSSSPYCFHTYSGVQQGNPDVVASMNPKFYHSPDGSIIALAVASPAGPWVRIALFDQAKGGGLFKSFDTSDFGGTISLTITSMDQVLVTQGMTSYGPYSIP
jgi:hypothetical protein